MKGLVDVVNVEVAVVFFWVVAVLFWVVVGVLGFRIFRDILGLGIFNSCRGCVSYFPCKGDKKKGYCAIVKRYRYVGEETCDRFTKCRPRNLPAVPEQAEEIQRLRDSGYAVLNKNLRGR